MQAAAGIEDLQALIQRILGLVVIGAFLVLLFLFLSAGFKYLTSGGEPKGVQSAHNTYTWALIGIALLLIVFVALRLISSFTGVDVTKFCLGFPGLESTTSCF